MILSDRDLYDKPVVTSDGHVIGAVDSVDLDTGDWSVKRLGVKLHRDALEKLGLKKPWIRSQQIKLDVRDIEGLADEVVLREKAADLDFAGGTPAKD